MDHQSLPVEIVEDLPSWRAFTGQSEEAIKGQWMDQCRASGRSLENYDSLATGRDDMLYL